MRLVFKNLLYLIICSIGLTTFNYSHIAYADIYKWRDAQGIIQYSDKPPAGSVKASRTEIMNALQTKDICAAPSAVTEKKTVAKYQSNFFGFNTPNSVGFTGQPVSRPFGLSGINPISNTNAARPTAAINGGRNNISNRPAAGFPSWFSLPAKNNLATNPMSTAPNFGGLQPTSFFNNGNNWITVFGRPFNVAAAKPPVKPAVPTPSPAPNPVPIPSPISNPVPTPAPAPIPVPAPVVTPPNPPAPALPVPSANSPANYNDNLAMIRKATTRNTLLDNSRFRNVAMANIPINDLLGAREDYLKLNPSRLPASGFYPDEGSEPDFPVQGVGSFRTACEFSHFSYDDPIVHPNKPGAAHLHMFWGNTDVNAYSTYNTLLNSGSSTCNGMELNRTAYWAPAMFDAQGNVRIPSKIIIYYKGYGLANGKSEVYPPGAAMVTDDKVHRSTTGGTLGIATEMNFLCSDQYRGDRTPATMTIPNCDGGRWQKVYPKYGAATMLEMHVKFGNCWNRQDAANPKNWILAKLGGWFYSDCQENATTPNIHYIIQYPLERDENTAGWYIASDVDSATRKRTLAAGSTVHADWWGGWNPTINKQWVDNCVNYKTAADHGCGFGYLTDGGPDGNKPLPGPALKFRQKYPGPFKVAASTLYKQLCDANKTITTPEQAAYCRPVQMNHAM